MDPISIIGTAGAVANIIDVVGKTINGIRQMANDYKEADLRFLTLLSQLTALRAAFNKIQEWMDSDLVDAPYYQLVMDLDVSISCCRLLLGRIESMLTELCDKDDGKLDVPSKLKLVFSQKSLDGLQMHLEQQTGALTLLLTACNCKTLADQKTILEKSGARKVIRRMEADTASLFVHRDTDSFMTQVTDRLSKLSVVFAFDQELFISNIYERVLRGSLKESLKMESRVLDPGKLRSQAIDRRIKDDSRLLSKECKVLVLGLKDSGKDKIITQMKLTHRYHYSDEELRMLRLTVYQHLLISAKALVSAMRQFEIEPEKEENKALCTKLMEYAIPSDMNPGIDSTVGEAISLVWRDPCIGKVLERSSEFSLFESTPYFFDEVKRITSSNYIPTKDDILRVNSALSGIHETVFKSRSVNIRILDIPEYGANIHKSLQMVGSIFGIMFVVNLADYDRRDDDSFQNRMMESLDLFDSVVNSPTFRTTTIILFLNNFEEFREKLHHSPLSTCFPDYTSGNDAPRAAKYILRRFQQVNREKLTIYHHITEPSDPSNIELVFSTVRKTLLNSLML